jgi:hypothetical protein
MSATVTLALLLHFRSGGAALSEKPNVAHLAPPDLQPALQLLR